MSTATGQDIAVVLETRVVRGAGGGPDKTILNTPRFLEGAGYQVLCAYMHPPDDPGFATLQRKAERWRAILLSIPDRGPLDWRVLREYLKICKRERVTIWHGHDYKSNLIGLMLRWFWPMHLVTTVHGWVDRRVAHYYWIDRFCLRHYDRVICVSDDLFQESITRGVPEERCLLIENAVDVVEFARTLSPVEARRRLGENPERLVVGAVGRLQAEKGFDLLIRAADRLLARGHNFEVWIVGEGDQHATLQALISELRREDRIRLLGYRANPIDVYQAMDIFALSSLREGLPNVVLEAMALEVPLTATRIAGIPRLIEHDVTGLIVEPGSVDSLEHAIERLLVDPNLRARLGRAGRASVEDRYSFDVRMHKIQKVLDDLLGRTSRTVSND
jgi:glycosyltransferase involved in cell wall biosynthesis